MKRFLRKRVPLVISAGILLSMAFLVAAPAFLAADETTDKVDKLFAAWDKTTTPGAGRAAGIKFVKR